jgi:long-chain acyl-CoA synthetase
VAPDAPAVILYTSGTTRDPTGVVLTHANVVSQVEAFRRLRVPGTLLAPRLLCLSPLSHSQGLVIGLVVPLSIGVGVLFSEAADPHHVSRTIRANRVNLLLAVPRIQHLVAQALRDSPYRATGSTIAERVRDVRSFPLRRHLLFLGIHRVLGYRFWVLLVGGAPLSPADERFWFECGLVLVQGYGLTETAALVSVRVNNPLFGRLGSIGRPLRNQEVEIDEGGELLVRGANVTPGVWDNGEIVAIEGVRAGGYIATGDLAERDPRRHLRFRGRRDELIVTASGSNVHARDVEEVLMRVDGVRDAVVTASADSDDPDVHAVLLLAGGVAADGVVRAANEDLEPYQRVHSWSVWPGPDFPRTSLGKVRRALVVGAEPAAASVPAAAPEDALPSLDAIRGTPDKAARMDLLAQVLAAPAPPADADGFSLFDDFGLGSLDIVELLARVERATSRASSEVVIGEQDSVGAVARSLAAPGSAETGRRRVPAMDRWLFRLGQRLVAPWLLPLWAGRVARVTVGGAERLAAVAAPFIVASAHHEHGADAILLHRALPRRMRRRLLVVTSDWLFQDYTASPRRVGRLRRLTVGVAYELGMPLLFPFALWPSHGVSRRGLLETGRLMDRGYSPVVFPGTDPGAGVAPGIGVMAVQTGAAVVPVRLSGNEEVTLRPRLWRRHVHVEFLEPIVPTPGMGPETVTASVAAALLGEATPAPASEPDDLRPSTIDGMVAPENEPSSPPTGSSKP